MLRAAAVWQQEVEHRAAGSTFKVYFLSLTPVLCRCVLTDVIKQSKCIYCRVFDFVSETEVNLQINIGSCLNIKYKNKHYDVRSVLLWVYLCLGFSENRKRVVLNLICNAFVIFGQEGTAESHWFMILIFASQCIYNTILLWLSRINPQQQTEPEMIQTKYVAESVSWWHTSTRVETFSRSLLFCLTLLLDISLHRFTYDAAGMWALSNWSLQCQHFECLSKCSWR